MISALSACECDRYLKRIFKFICPHICTKYCTKGIEDMTTTLKLSQFAIKLKSMKQFAVFFLLICFLFSCKEKVTYQMQIMIRNETDSIMSVKLFPKSEFILRDLYDYSEIGDGYRKSDFQISKGDETEIYISVDLNKKPYVLASQIFDSIYSVANGNRQMEIKFTPDKVVGYSDNLYNKNSEWIFEVRNFDLQTQFKSNPVESNDYIFVISQDKF